MKELTIIVGGRAYLGFFFSTTKEVNDFLEKNSDYGLLKESTRGGGWVARNDDKGIEIPKELP